MQAGLAAFFGEECAPYQQLTGSSDEEKEHEAARADIQRMRAALARTQPSQRSCEVRLALANWLHRRLRRGGLDTDSRPSWLLRHYRLLVALLRCTLQSQLSELAELAAASSQTYDSLSESESESKRPSKRARMLQHSAE